ncbi:MAG TPA: diphosphate--fructose-6-phosphate 1-phosphotransferase [Bryobacteraceae bacterium]
MMAGAALVAHGGGPTAVLNASLLGVVEEAREHKQISALYGAKFGISGILEQNFVDLLQQSDETLLSAALTPSSALGTSRREVTEQDLDRVLAIFRAHGVRYFFYNGGNGTMGTAGQIQALARRKGQQLEVVGIPKTIDNDLLATDHAPGYPSAARFFALAARDIGADNLALPGQVEFLEVLGRNVGWLAAATSLARRDADDAPHLIYLPETPLPQEQLLDDVQRVFDRLGRCVVAVCEGQLDEHGEAFGADVRTGSRGSLAMNLGHRLARLITERLNIRARSEKPGLLGRVSSLCIADADWSEARLCGARAVAAAVAGHGGNMVTLRRDENSPEYRIDTALAPLEEVALRERHFPAEWRNAEGNGILPEFQNYVLPLVGEIAPLAQIQDIPVAKRSL